jgi:hypothetical protein
VREAAQRPGVQPPRARVCGCFKKRTISREAVGWNGRLGGYPWVYKFHEWAIH